eukprot:1160087-Pelagomonas_calceolata.AAC.1
MATACSSYLIWVSTSLRSHNYHCAWPTLDLLPNVKLCILCVTITADFMLTNPMVWVASALTSS